MVEIKRLSYFVQVAADRSLSKASESLQIAQPALSRQIQLLEHYLGFRLFTRSSSGMKLTKEGESLWRSVVGPCRELELAVQNMRTLMSRAQTESEFLIDLGLGLHPALGQVAAKALIDKFRNDIPNVKIRMFEGTADTQLDWLKRGTIDFALLDYPASDDTVESRLLATEEVVLVGSRRPAFGGKSQRCKFSDLAELPLILPSHHYGIRKIVQEAEKTASLSLPIEFEIDYLPLQLELLLESKGYGFMPRSLAKTLSTSHPLMSVPITAPTLKMGTYMATRGFRNVEGTLMTRINHSIQDIVVKQVAGDAP